MKKLTVFLLILILLTSCAPSEEVSEEISGSDISQEVSQQPIPVSDPLSVLPDQSFGGTTVIWTTDPALASPDGAYDEAIRFAMQERIDAIENKFDTSVVIETKTESEINEALEKGEYFADLVIMPSDRAAQHAQRGRFANMWSLPYFATASKLLNGDAQKQTINNSLYMLTGDLCYGQQNALAVYVNCDLITSLGMRTPAYSVADGTWTVDKMLEYINVASTVAGKPSPDIEKDIFGFTTVGLNTEGLINVLWNGSGIDYFGTTMGKKLYADFDYELGKQATASVQKLFDSNTRLVETDRIDTKEVFLNGKSLFCITYFNNFTGEDRITGFDWEVLPLPKMTAQQDRYYSTVTESMCISVPASAENSHRAGLLLSAWILTSGQVCESLEQYYITYYSTNNVNTVMMKTVFDSAHYPINELYSSITNIENVGRKLIAASVTDNINLKQYIRWQDFYMDQTAEKFK